MKPLYGLIGRKLGHSFSEKYFADKFRAQGIDSEYRNFELESISQLPAMLVENPDIRGFNVTIPYKEDIKPYLDAVDPEAREIGAVNCVRIENGKLTGYNTDAYGFRKSLLELIGNDRPQALILGTGGAAKAVEYTLGKLGMEYIIVSRTPKPGVITYEQVRNNPDLFEGYKLIINTTPLGMFPDTESAPDLPYSKLTSGNYLFDLVYNPPLTKFLSMGKEQGAKIMNGQSMLEGQAERSWEIWTTSPTRANIPGTQQ